MTLGLGKALTGLADTRLGMPLVLEAFSRFKDVGDPHGMGEAVLATVPVGPAWDQVERESMAERATIPCTAGGCDVWRATVEGSAISVRKPALRPTS